MKRKLQLISLIVIIFSGYMASTISAAYDLISLSESVDDLANVNQASVVMPENYREIEEKILQSTVRFLIQTWIAKSNEEEYEIFHSEGHGTVKDGRFLVTHNHFGIPLSIRPQAGEPDLYSNITLFNSAGDPLFIGPLTDFQIIEEDTEMLIFAYKEEGLFEKLGFISAEFKAWQSLTVQPGMIAAQIDWDGSTTRVDWTIIREVIVDDGVPRLVLEDGSIVGASGGGIFWKGVHIANNWTLNETIGADGIVLSQISTAALNSEAMLTN